jgi:pyruvate,water dikinase
MADNSDFVSPFGVETPPGAEGWQRMYPYYVQFSEDRREFEEQQLWFHDSMHYPDPIHPFDLTMPENTWVMLNQNTTRVFRVPTARGLDHRVLNGYVYVSPSTIDDPDEIAARNEHFAERAGYYFSHWAELYEDWVDKARAVRERLEQITFEPLPEVEPFEVVTQHTPFTSGHRLITGYHRLLENFHEIAYLHFDMLGLGYGAYLTFRNFCQETFPGISDQSIAKMVAGIDILMFKPDDQLRQLARLAVEVGAGDALTAGGDPEQVLERVGAADRGAEWVAAFEEARDPWFWFCTGGGLIHGDPAWNDDLSIPFSVIGDYVVRLERGEDIERPLEQVTAERDRISSEYRALITSEEDRAAFDELLALATTVYPFVEDHNFYCEHQHHTRFWNKVRELGGVFAHHGYLKDREDIFYLHKYEVFQALWDLQTGWATENPDGRGHWQREIAERKQILEALGKWSPPPALGKAPEVVTEPFTVMLWGITSETLERWRRKGDGDGAGRVLEGVAASPGVAEGRARVILTPAELDQVQEGEILVCPITAPSWVPVFGRINAAVSDIGGIMAHAAIVSREYGLPAVVGTGFGTKEISTGQMIRVDGDNGRVEILD